MKERFQAGIWTQSCIYFSRTCISAIIEMVCIGYRALPFFFEKGGTLAVFGVEIGFCFQYLGMTIYSVASHGIRSEFTRWLHTGKYLIYTLDKTTNGPHGHDFCCSASSWS